MRNLSWCNGTNNETKENIGRYHTKPTYNVCTICKQYEGGGCVKFKYEHWCNVSG